MTISHDCKFSKGISVLYGLSSLKNLAESYCVNIYIRNLKLFNTRTSFVCKHNHLDLFSLKEISKIWKEMLKQWNEGLCSKSFDRKEKYWKADAYLLDSSRSPTCRRPPRSRIWFRVQAIIDQPSSITERSKSLRN